MGQAGGGQAQFLEVQVLFAGAHQAQLQLGSLDQGAPSHRVTHNADRAKETDDETHPEVIALVLQNFFGRHDDDKSVGALVLDKGFVVLLLHPVRPLPGQTGPRRPVGGGGQRRRHGVVGFGGQAIGAQREQFIGRHNQFGHQVSPQIHRILQGGGAAAPIDAALEFTLRQHNGVPGVGHDLIGVVKQFDGAKLVGINQIVEDAFESLLADHAAGSPARTHEFGADARFGVASLNQGVVQSFADADVFRRLPAQQRAPDGRQHSIDCPTAKGDHASSLAWTDGVGNRRRGVRRRRRLGFPGFEVLIQLRLRKGFRRHLRAAPFVLAHPRQVGRRAHHVGRQ